MKLVSKLAWALCPLALLGASASVLLERAVAIESVESKTTWLNPVYNQIQLRTQGTRDVWEMRQSHQGPNAPIAQWDHIRIVVDRKTTPAQVSYYQLEHNQPVELKASCYTCHANGPRALRPRLDSPERPLSVLDRATVALMNLRIKSYGPMRIQRESYRLRGEPRKVPLAFFSQHDQAPLRVATCLKCHNTEDRFGRGQLQWQHRTTIRQLVAQGTMPPWPYRLSAEEKTELERFLK